MSAPEKPFYFPLLSGSSPEKASSISSMPCQSLSNLRFIHRSRNQLFPQSYDSCLQSRPAPSPSPLLLSRLHLVFVSISTAMSSLQYRRYTLIRLLPPLLLSRLHLRIRLDILHVFFPISSIYSNPSP